MQVTWIPTPALVAGGAAVLLIAQPARASAGPGVFSWAAPVDGVWSDTTAWTPVSETNGPRNADVLLGLAGAYTVTLDISTTLESLTIANSDAVLEIPVGRILDVDGVDIAGTAVIRGNAGTDPTFSTSGYLWISDGGVVDGTVVLDAQPGTNPLGAVLDTRPFFSEQPVVFSETALVTGRGLLDGRFVNRGRVLADGPDGEIRFDHFDQVPLEQGPAGVIDVRDGARVALERGVDGGRVIGTNGARLHLGGPVTNTELSGAFVTTGWFTLGAGNTYDADIALDDVRISLAPGTAFPTVFTFLNEALISGPTSGNPTTDAAVFAEDVTLTGLVSLRGLLRNEATITVDGPGSRIDVSTAGHLRSAGTFRGINGATMWMGNLDGGVIEVEEGGVVAFSDLDNVTLRGTMTIVPSPAFSFIGDNTVLEGTILLGDGQSSNMTVLNIVGDSPMGGEIRMRAGPNGAGPNLVRADTFDPATVISGSGFVSTTWVPNIVRPGTLDAPGVIGIFGRSAGQNLTNPGFTDTAELHLNLFGLGADEFARIETGDRELTLAGTLRITPSPGVEPRGTDAIEIIRGELITGRFGEVIYEGPLSESDVARVYYEPERVVFAITCAADVALPVAELNILDVLAFLDLWNAGDPETDVNGDNRIDEMDVIAFIQQWSAGCPG